MGVWEDEVGGEDETDVMSGGEGGGERCRAGVEDGGGGDAGDVSDGDGVVGCVRTRWASSRATTKGFIAELSLRVYYRLVDQRHSDTRL